MKIIAQDKDGMTLYAQWYSTDGASAMREDGEIVNLDEHGYKLMIVNDDYFEKHLKKENKNG